MQPDPALGIAVQFPQAQFENAIRFAMQMGAPTDPNKRPKFAFPSTGKTYFRDGVQIEAPRLDWDGNPLDPTVEVRLGQPRTVSVDCAVEVERGGTAGQSPVGNFPVNRVVVTLLEAEWAKVQGCTALEYNGDRYVYDHEPEINGLFGSNVHTMIFISEDES